MPDTRKVQIPTDGDVKVGDILSYEHQPGKPTYYRAVEEGGTIKLAMIPKWQAEAQLREMRHYKILGELCAEAFNARN